MGERCCNDLGLKLPPTCHEPAFANETYESLFASAVQNGARLDEARATECLSQMRADSTCEGSAAPACDEVFIPTRTEGEPCDRNSHCLAPPGEEVVCELPDWAPVGDPGTCKVVRPVTELGAKCGGLPAPCSEAAGLACVSGTCEKLFAVGDSCTDPAFQCPTATYCDGVCTPIGQEGDACKISTCNSELYCDDQTSTCKAVKKTDEPCVHDRECGGSRCDGGQCKPQLRAVCVPD